MRFANIAFAAAGVVFTYLLATELAGATPRRSRCRGDRRPRPARPYVLLPRPQRWACVRPAGIALLWAGVRCLRRPDRRNLFVLGAVAAVASGTRTATMLLAVVVVAAVAFVQLVRLRSEPWRRRACNKQRPSWRLVSVPLPCCSDGSTSGSSCSTATSVLDLLARPLRPGTARSIPFVITQGRLWVHLFHRMASTAPLSWAWPRFANIVGLVAIVGLVVALVRPRRTSRRAIAVCLVAVRGHHADRRPASR